jgi:hypothetical protein
MNGKIKAAKQLLRVYRIYISYINTLKDLLLLFLFYCFVFSHSFILQSEENRVFIETIAKKYELFEKIGKK